MQVKSTYNYDAFKFVDRNRPIRQNHVETIISWFKANFMMDLFPAVVNKKMEVMDGQHRILACKAMNLPVYYQIGEDITEEMIPDINACHRKWDVSDYCNFYAKGGNDNYKRLISISEKHNLPISVTVKLLYNGSRSLWPLIRTGRLVVSEHQDDELIFQYKEIKSFLKDILKSDDKAFLATDKFTGALMNVLRKVDFDRFFMRLKMSPSKVHICSSTKDYEMMLDNIYKHKRSVKKEEDNEF